MAKPRLSLHKLFVDHKEDYSLFETARKPVLNLIVVNGFFFIALSRMFCN